MVLSVLSSCVSNKKFLYLQKDDVNKKDLPKDTVVRRYSIQLPEYKIQPEDIGQMVADLLHMNPRTLPSKIEVRPSMPGK